MAASRVLSWPSAGTVGTRSATRPRSSGVETRLRAWVMNGSDASMVGPVDLTAGRSAAASARTAGKDALSASSAGPAARSVRGSSAIVCSSADWLRENAAAVRLKSVIRLCSCGGLASSASATVPASRMKPLRSPGCRPRVDWLTRAVFL